MKACRLQGITVPILPGIMPIQSYAGFKKMTELCKTKVPPHISEALENPLFGGRYKVINTRNERIALR